MYLNALGHFHPQNVITNEFLTSLGIDTNDQWIVERVGIRTRHTVLPLSYIRETKNKNPAAAIEAAEMSNAETGAEAARMALARATKSHVHALGLNWDDTTGRNNGHYAPFAWRSA